MISIALARQYLPLALRRLPHFSPHLHHRPLVINNSTRTIASQKPLTINNKTIRQHHSMRQTIRKISNSTIKSTHASTLKIIINSNSNSSNECSHLTRPRLFSVPISCQIVLINSLFEYVHHFLVSKSIF